MAEVIGSHISPNHGRAAPNGRSLIKRVNQIKEAQRQFPVPMILFHRSPMRLENLQRTAANLGSAKKPFTPSVFAVSLCVTALNTNSIVRELLALRAKHSLARQ